jgi:hypothetical protein
MRFSSSLLVPVVKGDESDFEDFRKTERMAQDYFKRLGFEVHKLEPRSDSDKVALRILHSLNLSEKIFTVGVPDFICWNRRVFFFVECKSGKSQLSDSQIKWVREYMDDFDILILKVKPDNKNYIPRADPCLAGFSQLRDEFRMAIQTFETLGCGTKIRNEEGQSSDLPKDIDAQENDNMDGPVRLAYRQLANMDYANSKLIMGYSEINTILDRKNRDPDKYKVAYLKLKMHVDSYFNIMNDHRKKAMDHLGNIISTKGKSQILLRSVQETESLKRSYTSKQEYDYDLKFKSAKDYLDENQSDSTLH